VINWETQTQTEGWKDLRKQNVQISTEFLCMRIFLSSGLLLIWSRNFTFPNFSTAGRLSATKEEISPCSLPHSLQFIGLFYGGCRTQCPPGLRRESAAARSLRSRVRMPQGYGCLSLVIVECCQVEVSASSAVLPSVVCLWSWSLDNKGALAH